MKKVIFTALAAVFIITACSNDQTTQDELYKESIEKGKSCTPSDRNCNGIPDSDE
jgi:uncharacterized lipoprotein NlpE involved in copper resistance